MLKVESEYAKMLAKKCKNPDAKATLNILGDKLNSQMKIANEIYNREGKMQDESF